MRGARGRHFFGQFRAAEKFAGFFFLFFFFFSDRTTRNPIFCVGGLSDLPGGRFFGPPSGPGLAQGAPLAPGIGRL